MADTNSAFSYPVAPHVNERTDELVASFASSTPVKHVIIDDFLDADYAEQLYKDLPDPNAMPKSRDYMFSDKRELSTLDRHSEISKQLHEVFMSPAFAQLASKLVGPRGVPRSRVHRRRVPRRFRGQLPRPARRLQHPPRPRQLAARVQHPAVPEPGMGALAGAANCCSPPIPTRRRSRSSRSSTGS